ncbi:MAG: GNAT family N-acetyltransferase [Microscillaceae bacterium]|jgi:GNAT superfamily N-acetyltransferase|nr:GNAT family N-acetyltransferase [Microscillaceae bacterium]
MDIIKISRAFNFPLSQKLLSGEAIEIRFLQNTDNQYFIDYIEALSDETRQKFQPHSFDRTTLMQICQNPATDYGRLVVYAPEKKRIIAYFLIFAGLIAKDQARFAAQAMPLNSETDCTFAPSVADDYQNQQLGSLLMPWLIKICQFIGYQRVILWGGVQAQNHCAIRFYEKFGFQKLAMFQNKNGDNWDMYLPLLSSSQSTPDSLASYNISNP